MSMTVQSTSWSDGALIGDAYAFGVLTDSGPAPQGGNRSPQVSWSDAPEGTRSFALLVVDPDVPEDAGKIGQEGVTIGPDEPRRDFAHWVVVDIPGDVTEVAEGAGSDGIVLKGKPTGATSFGGVTGINDYTSFFAGDADMGGSYGGYDGPFPPPNDLAVHHYHLTVFALDVPTLGLSGDFDVAAARRAMEGHILDSASVVGRYSLHPDTRATI
jgi:Raf kinase inhibitor-like YbhB/YbcL family protein